MRKGLCSEYNISMYGIPFTVSYCDPDLFETDPGDEGNLLGRSKVKTGEVFVDKNLCHELSRATTLHELIHIMGRLYSIPLPENVVDVIAMGFDSLLKDNFQFIKDMYDER